VVHGRTLVDWNEPPVDDDPSAQDVRAVDSEPPHRQAVIGPPDLRRYPDWHRLVDRFENTDRAGELAITHRTGTAGVCEVRCDHCETGVEARVVLEGSGFPGIGFFEDCTVLKFQHDATGRGL